MSQRKKIVHLALQGGGAHGAFSWGILDKLLEDGRLEIDGIAATSAGSMNAVVYAYGKMEGGPEGAREALHNFWYNISKTNPSFLMGGYLLSPLEFLLNRLTYLFVSHTSHVMSPYQFNPNNLNYLRDVLENQIDFKKLKSCKTSNLFISATNVRTGAVRIFNNEELSINVVLASACLPYLFQAVKIGRDYYWDGGYMGNPPIFPLFYHGTTTDVIVVHINPIHRAQIPTQAHEIMNRINEITFNSSLIQEFRAVAFVNKLLEEDWLKDEFKNRLRHIFVHSIRADKALHDYEVSTKYDTSWHFLQHLRDLGRHEAEKWLHHHYNQIGKKSTVDLHRDFLNPK